jgi:DNA-binding GntR family transcriptional regulator
LTTQLGEVVTVLPVDRERPLGISAADFNRSYSIYSVYYRTQHTRQPKVDTSDERALMTSETAGLRLDSSVSRRVTAVDLVRDALRAAILRGDLPGGARLVQTDIATQLEVSTTPVREAMRDLASEGLITLDSHRIGTVRKPDWEEMGEIVEIRRSLETMAIRRAMANITDQQLDEATSLADVLAEEEDLGSWVQKNSQFHNIFHRATSTRRLAGMLQGLEEASGVFVAAAQRLHPEIRRRAVADHYALLDAYRDKDLERAVEIQLAHVMLPLENADQES